MSIPQDFTTGLDELKDCITRAGDDIQEPIESEEHIGQHIGFTCKRAGYTYQVHGQPGVEFFRIEVPFNIAHDMGATLDEDDAREVVHTRDPDEWEGDIQTLAALEILEQMSPSNRKSFKFHLTEQLTTSDTGHSLRQLDNGTIWGFDVFRRVFPNEDGYSVAEFDHSVQACINSAHRGILFVADALDFESIIALETADAPDKSVRYIH